MRLILTVSLVLIACPALAQSTVALEGKRFALLKFVSAPGTQIQPNVALSDTCLEAVGEAIRPFGGSVITRVRLLRAHVTVGDCDEGELEAARHLGVDYFVTGTLSLVDGGLLLALKAHEAKVKEEQPAQTRTAAKGRGERGRAVGPEAVTSAGCGRAPKDNGAGVSAERAEECRAWWTPHERAVGAS